MSNPQKKIGPVYSAVLDKASTQQAPPAAPAAAAEAPAASSAAAAEQQVERATLAAGCFWGVELAFQRIPGVKSTQVGYIGGETDAPTYREVCTGSTGHAEAVELTFLPGVVSYDELLDVFFERHDPTTRDRQQNDVGTQYRSAIFTHSDEQQEKAVAALARAKATWGDGVVTQVVSAPTFWPAEDKHQKYLEKGGQCSLKGDKTAIRCYG